MGNLSSPAEGKKFEEWWLCLPHLKLMLGMVANKREWVTRRLGWERQSTGDTFPMVRVAAVQSGEKNSDC